MHKKIPKERYIAASNKCTTKTLSTIITQCLKLVTKQHRRLCYTIEKRTGVNRMWVIDNSADVLEKIDYYNDNTNARNVWTYDFSTLYTNIPHTDLKKKMKWVVEKAFDSEKRQKIYVDKYNSTASWSERKNAYIVSKNTLIKYINFLVDNIFIKVGDHIFRQNIGIPMGTDCAPFLANLYLYALEFDYLEKTTKKDIFLARKFTNSFRYIDDLLSFNNFKLIDKCKHKIYPKELVLNCENGSQDLCTFLDIHMHVVDGIIHTKLYDKRDDFKFTINNYPNLSGNIHAKRTHDIIISQLLRYSRVCKYAEDFISTSKTLLQKLLTQFFNRKTLIEKFSMFYTKYYHLLEKYNCSKKYFITRLFN